MGSSTNQYGRKNMREKLRNKRGFWVWVGSEGPFSTSPVSSLAAKISCSWLLKICTKGNSLASLTRGTGPKVVRGDPAQQSPHHTPKVSSHHHHFTPTISVSDSALKFTHVLYNLSPAELYEQAINNEKARGRSLRQQAH